MRLYGRIVKVNKKSTLIWNDGRYIELNFVSSHSIGDIIDAQDNLITKCYLEYEHEKDRQVFNRIKNKFLYIKNIEKFFDNMGFVEVFTRKLKNHILRENNISLMKTPYGYLAPSPEVEIKKLIALGFNKVFELCFAYRDDYEDALHKKEFLILEWYRPLETYKKIIDDFIAMIKYLNKGDILRYHNLNINLNKVEFVRYDSLLREFADIDVWNIDIERVKNKFNIEGRVDKIELLDAVFALKVEKHLGLKYPVVVYDFPYQRAALSKIENGYAKRFETYIAGIELSNCYSEENNYGEIVKRFENTDEEFFDAMKKGIPGMAGIAVGVDRLIMLLENETSIL